MRKKIILLLCQALTGVTSFATVHRQVSMAGMADDVAVSYSLTSDQLTLHEPIIVAFSATAGLYSVSFPMPV